MAACPQFIERYIARNGRWLYHTLSDPSQLHRVLAEGLRPASQLAQARSWQNPSYAPRPDHVYLGEARRVFEHGYRYGSPLLAVDLRALDSARINPDEDLFWSAYGPDTHGLCSRYQLTDPYWTVADPDSDSLLLELIDRQDDWEAARAEALAARRWRSYGQWARAMELGSDVAQTQESLERLGQVAVEGGVPAGALRVTALDWDNAECEVAARYRHLLDPNPVGCLLRASAAA